MSRARWFAAALWALFVAPAEPATAYPLDGFEATGITRLQAYELSQTGLVSGPLLPPGARLPGATIQLHLVDRPDFAIPPPDPGLTESITALLEGDAEGFGISVLDLTDPAHPRYAGHNDERNQNPGSVGKLMVALAWLQALADAYPDDVAARHALLYSASHAADPFIQNDSHDVPFWQLGDAAVEFRPIRLGDTGNLWTWLDWMVSSSSNAAASTIMAQLMLLREFGPDYPPPPSAARKFFAKPTSELSRRFREAIQSPITRNGLDVTKLRQGSFFTRYGKAHVPGTNSVSSPLELTRLMVKMEQGKLVDPASSLDLKRLLYLTERRIRYASSLALRRSAVYFKSGSLYKCKPEKGFTCEKYHGNVINYLNSVVMVEAEGPPRLHYIVSLLTNVLRKDSTALHRQLATEIHHIMERDHGPGGSASGPAAEGDTPFDGSPLGDPSWTEGDAAAGDDAMPGEAAGEEAWDDGTEPREGRDWADPEDVEP